MSEPSGVPTAATARPRPGHVVVVGGGLAGIAAAVSLADRGAGVTLLESRPRLGGAAYSFDRGGLTVDTGTHVVLRCYAAYRYLLGRMGVAGLVPVQPRMSITVLRPGSAPARLRRGLVGPAPLHLLPAVAGYRELSARQRLSTIRAALALRRADPDDRALDRMTVSDWLRRRGQDEHTIDVLWGLLCVAALNIDPARASAALMARVLRTGLLDHVASGDIGVPAAPLSALHDGPARALLERLGVRCRVGVKVTGIERDGVGYRVGTRSGGVPADAVICAVPHRHAAALIPAEAVPGRDRWARLDASPIVNVHLHLDRVVTADALPRGGFAAVLGSPLQWVFDRTTACGATGQYLVSSVSAADAAITRPAADLLAEARRELDRLFPAAAGARLIDGFVTREPHATFRQQAGSASHRPGAVTDWPGLVLAGSWTDTGLPDTLEGAVRSGFAAADALGGGHAPARKTRTGPACRLPGLPRHDDQLEVVAR